MGKFNLEDYEPVDERIKRALKDHADFQCTTDLVSNVDKIEEVAVFKSTVTWGGLVFTGYAMERANDGYINKTSHVENCETSAIGRALANGGYSGSKRPSREEMNKTMNDAPDDAAERQQKHFEEMEHKSRAKAKDLIDSCRNVLDDDVCMDFEVRLADAKGFDAVVAMGKEIRAALEDIDPDTPRTKKQVAETMKK